MNERKRPLPSGLHVGSVDRLSSINIVSLTDFIPFKQLLQIRLFTSWNILVRTTTFFLPCNSITVLFLVVVFFAALACTYYHIKFFPSREVWKIRPVDPTTPIYTMFNIETLLISALGFGKPYSPAVITVIGFFVNFWISLIFPGVMYWNEKTLSVLVVLALSCQFFWSRVCQIYRRYFN